MQFDAFPFVVLQISVVFLSVLVVPVSFCGFSLNLIGFGGSGLVLRVLIVICFVFVGLGPPSGVPLRFEWCSVGLG